MTAKRTKVLGGVFSLTFLLGLPGAAQDAAAPEPAAGAAGDEARLEELGPNPDPRVGIVLRTPDLSHVAIVAAKGSRQQVIVNGEAGPVFDEVLKVQAGSQYEGRPGYFLPQFSADGSRFAYAARRGETFVVVVDGQESEELDALAPSNGFKQFFSPDGSRYAYVATRGQQRPGELNPDLKDVLIVDGKVFGEFPTGVAGAGIQPGSVTFSPDSAHLIYVVHSMEEGRVRPRVFVDSEPAEQAGAGNDFIFSSTGRLAYIAAVDRGVAAVIDQEAQGPYREVTQLQFSANGEGYIYFAHKDVGNTVVVYNGKEVPITGGQGHTEQVAISPDGQRAAHSMTRRRDMSLASVCVVDGKPGLEYEQIQWIGFSPDSGRVAYAAMKDQIVYLVIDGEESDGYDGFTPESFRFSPDGAHHAYLATVQGQQVLVIDGKASPVMRQIDPASVWISDDWSGYGFHGLSDYGTPTIVANGETYTDVIAATPDYARIVHKGQSEAGTPVYKVNNKDAFALPEGVEEPSEWAISTDGGHIACIARRATAPGKWGAAILLDGREISAIAPEGQGYHAGAMNLRFSPDGKHLAWLVNDGERQFGVVDGQPGPALEGVSWQEHDPFGLPVWKDDALVYLGAKDGKVFRVTHPGRGIDAVAPAVTGEE